MRCSFFDVSSLVAMFLFAALLPVCVLMLARASNTSLMLLMYRLSCAAVPLAYSSGSADEGAIVACVLLP